MGRNTKRTKGSSCPHNHLTCMRRHEFPSVRTTLNGSTVPTPAAPTTPLSWPSKSNDPGIRSSTSSSSSSSSSSSARLSPAAWASPPFRYRAGAQRATPRVVGTLSPARWSLLSLLSPSPPARPACDAACDRLEMVTTGAVVVSWRSYPASCATTALMIRKP